MIFFKENIMTGFKISVGLSKNKIKKFHQSVISPFVEKKKNRPLKFCYVTFYAFQFPF